MAKFKDRTGETNKTKNGQEMTIKIYINSRCMTVEFEDGTIVNNVTYSHFKKGEVGNPNFKTVQGTSLNEMIMLYYFTSLGFAKKDRNKQTEYGIYEYDLFNKDLKLAIEYDGDPRSHTNEKDKRKNDDAQKHGVAIWRIRTPDVPAISDKRNKIFNLENSYSFGKSFEKLLNKIIDKINSSYKKEFKTKVDFERDYDLIMAYVKDNYAIKSENYIGQSTVAKNGQLMAIIEFISLSNITVQFEDGTIVRNKTYNHFKEGSIGNPNYNARSEVFKNKYLGQSKITKNNQTMTIIGYNNYLDITVQFDDGTIVEHRTLEAFRKNKIGNPNLIKGSKKPEIKNSRTKDRIGESIIANNGQIMTIIKYINCLDIDVQFDDGTIVEHKSYKEFKSGHIANPNFLNPKFQAKKERIGESRKMKCGLTATIIEYFTTKNITVQFEDGTILKNKKYSRFLEGSIRNPNLKQKI